MGADKAVDVEKATEMIMADMGMSYLSAGEAVVQQRAKRAVVSMTAQEALAQVQDDATRRATIEHLFMLGRQTEEIAAQLGIAPQQVKLDLAYIKAAMAFRNDTENRRNEIALHLEALRDKATENYYNLQDRHGGPLTKEGRLAMEINNSISRLLSLSEASAVKALPKALSTLFATIINQMDGAESPEVIDVTPERVTTPERAKAPKELDNG